MAGPPNLFGGPVNPGGAGGNAATPAVDGDLSLGASAYQLADTTAGNVTLDLQDASAQGQTWYFLNDTGANSLIVRDDSGGAPVVLVTLAAGEAAAVIPGPSGYAVWGPLQGAGAGAAALAAVLAVGNVTGARDIILTAGQALQGEDTAGPGVDAGVLRLQPGEATGAGGALHGNWIAGNPLTGQTLGNRRGNFAFDTQIWRSAATQVASGPSSAILCGEYNTIAATAPYAAIIGGSNNTVSDNDSVVLGGYAANISAPYSVIAGGEYNTCSGSHSLVSGLNNDNLDRDNIVGGRNNTANSSRMIVTGVGNNVTGTSAAVSGSYNTVSGVNALVAGEANNVSPSDCGCIGRYNTIPTGAQDCFAMGNYTVVPSGGIGNYGIHVTSDDGNVGTVANNGSAQSEQRPVTLRTTTAVALDKDLIIRDGLSYGFKGVVTARQVAGAAGTVGDTHSFDVEGIIKNIGGVATLIASTVADIGTDAAAATWTVAFTASGANLRATVTGELNKTIHWHFNLRFAVAGAAA